MSGRETTHATASAPTALKVGGIMQRKCAGCGQHTVAGGGCSDCKNKKSLLQRRASSDAAASEVPSIVHDVLRSPGQPLDPSTRAFMEPRLGHDFSQVRVHADMKAAESARAVNALAYTVGRNVVFEGGRYAPGTSAGNRLLAHELTHVVQQQEGSLQGKLHLDNEANNSFELEANRAEQAIESSVSTAKSPLTLRRKPTPGSPARLTGVSEGKPNPCSKSEDSYKRSVDYCKDTKATGKLHIGKRWKNADNTDHEHPITSCYRQVPKRTGGQCPAGEHVCFDAFGHCGDDHMDQIAPFGRGPEPEHECSWSPLLCALRHFAADVLNMDQGRIETPLDTPGRDDSQF